LATAFIILQAAQIIIPALLIPEWTLRLLVVLAILGFPVIIILSWIYDVGDKGIIKTDSIKSDDELETGMAKSSIMGIIASIAITIFMVYKGVDYFSNTKEVTGKTSIAVLNFDNIRKIDEYEWLGDDIAGSLSYTLGGIPEVRVIDRFQILNKLGEVDPEKASILEYKINQIANTIDVDLILHGQFTILDSIVKVIAVYADTKTFSQTPIMNEKYSLNELSDIPTYINDKISDFINNDPRFKGNSK
jgi:TolB-like protein